MFSQNLSLFWPGLEIGFVQFPSQNPCEKLETSLSARHVWESCLCRKRNHLDGRWELSKMFSSFFLGNFCRSHYCKNLCQIGEVGDFIHSDRYNEMKNRCSILFLLLRNWENVSSFGEELFRLCEGMVKQRTCHTNYAPMLAVLRFQFEIFRFCHLLSNKDTKYKYVKNNTK